MSRPQQWWRFPVVLVIRAYPILKKKKDELKNVPGASSLSGSTRSSAASRTTENLALRSLSRREEDDFKAVADAFALVERLDIGEEVKQVVELYHWKGVRNFDTVGYLAHMSARTARRRNDLFIKLVAKNLGYL